MEEKVYTIVPETIEHHYMGNYEDKDVVRPSYCYLHGKLEELVGYDIFGMLKAELLPEQINEYNNLSEKFEEGIYPCICMGKPCTFFRWKTEEHHRSYAGLVVLDYDLKAYEYAFKSYYNNENNI